MSNHQEMEINFFGSDPNRSGAQGWSVHSLTVDFGVDPEDLGAVTSFVIRTVRRALEGGMPRAIRGIAAIDIPGLSDSVRDAGMEQAFDAAIQLVRYQRCGWTDFSCYTKLIGSSLPGSSCLTERQFMSGHLAFAGMEVGE